MRIKDLATRATKLLAGNSWFAVDNGSKVDKVGYSAMVQEAIEEYNGTSLGGQNRSVKSAIDTLNSKLPYVVTGMDAYTYNSLEGMTALFNGLPTTYYGIVQAQFKGGYRVVGLVCKSIETYGSILYIADVNVSPKVLTVDKGTYRLFNVTMAGV